MGPLLADFRTKRNGTSSILRGGGLLGILFCRWRQGSRHQGAEVRDPGNRLAECLAGAPSTPRPSLGA